MGSIRDNLHEYIQNLCTSGTQILDQTILESIKAACKNNNDAVEICYELLLNELDKDHAEIRYSAFQICDALFDLSHRFRELILDDFQTFVEKVLETNNEDPLPPPKKIANELKKLAAIKIKLWHEKYGKSYTVLNLGFNYLKNCKKIDFVSFNHQNIAERRHVEQQNKKKEILSNEQSLKCIQEMNEKENDIKTCIEQMERCFEILIPKPDELFNEASHTEISKIPEKELNNIPSMENENSDSDTDSDSDFIEVKQNNDDEEELRYLGFLNDRNSQYVRHYELNLNLNFTENEDNRILIETMKDFYKELKIYLDIVNIWIKAFSAVKTANVHLKNSIDLKNSIQSNLKRFEDLKIPIEDNKKKKLEETKKPLKQMKKPTNFNHTTDGLKKMAPIVDLSQMQFGVSVTSKVEAAHRYYQRNDVETLNEEQPTLTKKLFIGEFEPVKWKCRAPLGNGKLCERMDRYKCPFHGKIIGRNSKTGEATNKADESLIKIPKKLNTINKDDYSPFGDASLIADIEAATGRNLSIQKGRKKKKKIGNLTDLNVFENTPRRRLEKLVLNSKSMRKVGAALDSIEQKQNHERFHHNFNYSLSQ